MGWEVECTVLFPPDGADLLAALRVLGYQLVVGPPDVEGVAVADGGSQIERRTAGQQPTRDGRVEPGGAEEGELPIEGHIPGD